MAKRKKTNKPKGLLSDRASRRVISEQKKKAWSVVTPPKPKGTSKKSIIGQISVINNKLKDNKLNLTEKRKGEKVIRDLKRKIEMKTNVFFPSEIERLKSERKSLSRAKSYQKSKLKDGSALSKKELLKTQFAIFKLNNRQNQIDKWLNPEKFDKRRKENKERLEKERAEEEKEKWNEWIMDVPLYQVSSDILDVISLDKGVKTVKLNGKVFKKAGQWEDMYLEWQSMYSKIMYDATDHRTQKLTTSDHYFGLMEKSNFRHVKIIYNGGQI